MIGCSKRCHEMFNTLQIIFDANALTSQPFFFSHLLQRQPKIDEAHPTWLHLRIREFDPKFDQIKNKDHQSGMSNHVADGRWVLGFPNDKACEAARWVILEETRKQRSSVESLLSPLLCNDYLEDVSNGHDE